jgi:NDP-sugar pyrophosphorylase family protein
MKAMILAGGMSTRLYPLTKEVPKPLVPIAGEPVVAHLLRYLASFGITEVGINIFYLAEKIREALGDGSRYGVTLTYLEEDRLMGSAGSAKAMESFLGDETFVIVGCDDVTDMNLEALIAFHKKRGAEATIGLYEAPKVDQFGVVLLDREGRITGFQEKPAPGEERSNLVNTGIYVFEPSVLRRIPANTFYDFGKQVFPEMQNENAPFYGLLMPGAYWCDVGTPDEYRRATNDLLSGALRLRGVRARGTPADAKLGDDVHIEGDVRVSSGAVLGARATIVGPSVVGEGVTIGEGARIERSILWDGVTIGDGAHVRDAIVGLNYHVSAGETLDGVVVANEPVAT